MSPNPVPPEMASPVAGDGWPNSRLQPTTPDYGGDLRRNEQVSGLLLDAFVFGSTSTRLYFVITEIVRIESCSSAQKTFERVLSGGSSR